MNFTCEEVNLMALYNSGSRERLNPQKAAHQVAKATGNPTAVAEAGKMYRLELEPF